jgi:hypothetical protein
MSDDGPLEYNKEFTVQVDRWARRRIGIDVERGKVTRFVV